MYSILALLFFCSFSAFAEEIPPTYFHKTNTPGLKRIADNSFLLEEAYNQERGVLQFIQSAKWNKRAKRYDYTFANEIPITDEKHQFSYTIPMSHYYSNKDRQKDGIGDVSLEYRTQWVKRPDEVLAATKFSLLLPTGSPYRKTGSGYPGLKINNALTSILSDKFVMHWNAGVKYYPKYKNTLGDVDQTVSFNWGTSLFYMYSESFNVFAEFVTEENEEVNDTAFDDTTGNRLNLKPGTSRSATHTLNPGMRWAFDGDDGSQYVPGISFPMTFATVETHSERGVLLYFSYENKYW